MKQAGQIVLFKFPKVDLEEGKLRPVLLISKLPGEYDDLQTKVIYAVWRLFWTGSR